MTRSEEEVILRKQQRPRERIRLKKYVVTDYVLEREPPEATHDHPTERTDRGESSSGR